MHPVFSQLSANLRLCSKAIRNYLQEYTRADNEVAGVEAARLSRHWNFIISVSLRAEKYDRGVAMQAQFVFV